MAKAELIFCARAISFGGKAICFGRHLFQERHLFGSYGDTL
jgi:hypothetical protein